MDPSEEILRRERIKTQQLQDLLRHYAKKNHQQRIKQDGKPPEKVQPPSDLNKRRREKNIKNQQKRTKNMGPTRIPYHLKF